MRKTINKKEKGTYGYEIPITNKIQTVLIYYKIVIPFGSVNTYKCTCYTPILLLNVYI